MKKLFLLGAFAVCGSSLGLDTTGDKALDLGVRIGGLAGRVVEEDPVSQVRRSFVYGGFPIGLGYHKDFLRWLTVHADVHFVLDPLNAQITRTGVDFGFAFHVFGGARRTFTDYGDTELMVRDPYNVSLVLRSGFYSYNATASGTDAKVTGSIFDTNIGVEYRFDTSPETAFAVEVYAPLYNLPAGTERITSTLISVWGSWRFFL